MPASRAGSKRAIFRQVCELIPPHLVPKLARKHRIKSRGITPWSHLVSMLYAQFTHAIGLNDVVDALRAHRAPMAGIRGAKPPSRNGLSHANRTRDPKMAEELFWSVLEYFERLRPGFGGVKFRRLPRRFKRTVYALDSTTIKLFANCMDWAKHRRRKAAAKLHLRLNLESFLPAFAIVDSARGHDSTKAHELCAGLKAGEIAVFDMAYIDYTHLFRLAERGVFRVSRVRESMNLRCMKRLVKKPAGRILRDDLVLVQNPGKRKDYPKRMRRIVARIEINGEDRIMTFFTNNFEWAASSICDLYKARWNIETFFKQIKQTLHLSDFLGHNRKAIEWPLWTALLMYVLLRFLHTCSDWAHSFTRLFTCLRAVLWQRLHLLAYLKSYGTAQGSFRMQWAPQQAYLPGLGLSPL
ncbi:IS4 family transposase [Kiritimatiella glycovorans]|uniref:Transposase DDE domain protein n=1 Tax=Kiritimatiella glycovorans TaxID=1307763 RepID=A0A0G3EJ12_9BACT|nr:IS4 family transposase [Kiritimatiella glycovorans]AKJ64174.1 Transposase DDE domain protein [Kiritimatiella glycovorans]